MILRMIIQALVLAQTNLEIFNLWGRGKEIIWLLTFFETEPQTQALITGLIG